MLRFYLQNNLLILFIIYLLCNNKYQLQLLFLYKLYTDKMSVSTHTYVITTIVCLIIFKWFGNQIYKLQSKWRHNTKCMHSCNIHTNQKPQLHDDNHNVVCVF